MIENHERSMQSWWSPGGWDRALEPEAFASIQIFTNEGRANAGYERAAFGDEAESSAYVVEILEHSDGHLAVILDLPLDRWLNYFFVQREHASAFYVDKLPALLLAAAAVDQTAATARLQKTITAFVRHGHGDHVIDEHGSENMEERRRREAEWRRNSAERRKSSAQ